MMKVHRLLIAFLPVLALAACEQNTPTNESYPATSAVQNTAPEADATGLKIAYIHGDTINENYKFLIDARKELESEERVMEERVNRRIKKAEERFMELQQASATMTQADMQEAQLELESLDLEIRQFQERLAADYRKREVELQKEYLARVDSFLNGFNADGYYDMIFNYQRGGSLLWIKSAHDITDTVISGLNDQYDRSLLEKKEAENAKK